MRATLTTPLALDVLTLFAEMAWLERRPELGALCRAVRDAGRLSVEVVDSVLPGLTDAGRDNLASWCRMLGLVDGGHALTSLGHEVADTDDAPVPEQGVYDLVVTAHPLVGRRILEAQRTAAGRGPRFEDIGPLNQSPDQGVVFRSVLDPTQRFVLRDLPTNHGHPGRLVNGLNASCAITWTLDFDAGTDSWRMHGALPQGRSMATIRHEAESAELDLARLLEVWAEGPLEAHGTWADGVLGVAAADLTDDERTSFRRALTLERVEIDGLGAWSDVQLEDVPIGPETDDDALAWGTALLLARLHAEPRPRTRPQLGELLESIVLDSPLAAWPAQVPSHTACLDAVDAADPSRRTWWSLAAPVDLAPAPVPPTALDALGVR